MSSQPVTVNASPGSDTRHQLISESLKLFARYGYEGTTTRQLAKAAGANIAAIAYHFGGKEGLYKAVIEHIIEDTAPIAEPLRDALRDGIAEARGDRAALARLTAGFVSKLMHQMVGNERFRINFLLALREFSNPSEAFSILYENRIKHFHKAVTQLAAAATGGDPEAPESIMRAHAVMGQMLIFLFAKPILLARLDWDSYTPDRLDEMTKTVVTSVLLSLGLEPPPPNTQPLTPETQGRNP